MIFDVRTLNCPKIDCETKEFFENNNFYLYVKSPVDGFLSVFVEENGETTRRLLPYKNQGNTDAVKIEHDKEYYLFSNAKGTKFFDINVDELVLFTNSQIEYDNVYVLFSPNKYIKPSLLDAKKFKDGSLIPKEISNINFQKWLAGCRQDPQFQDQKIKIVIKQVKQ